ncbi:hypothetical protein D0Z08_01725 [Nocardioides immobilis]|uniref:Uncharacterized protein n=1 Tax=Nocardioides immobilis TaxID=2049295 RepID=A0A417Y815_9ACTN|nr:hypothetical protein [Nocardioides immobilis]RHW28606.1 hypothetical protein D0Z08_01725 [Nocardioides immobilis]
MITPPAGLTGDVYDESPDFVYTVSLLAALEGAAGQEDHRAALPHLGMARAELVDYGQRRPTHYVDVYVDDFRAGLAELEERLTAMLTTSQVHQQSLRLEAARRLLRCGITAAGVETDR